MLLLELVALKRSISEFLVIGFLLLMLIVLPRRFLGGGAVQLPRCWGLSSPRVLVDI